MTNENNLCKQDESMKTIYLLFVVLTDQSGYETMLPVTNTKHLSMLECKVEKVQYKDIDNRLQFFCGDETIYFNKQQMFY